MLGLMYYSGKWVTANLKTAYEWYNKAAGDNNSVALLMLGVFNMEGKLFPKDIAKAKQYFKKVILNNDDKDAKNVAIEKLRSIQ